MKSNFAVELIGFELYGQTSVPFFLRHTLASVRIASLDLSSLAPRHFVKILVDQPFVILMQDLDAEM